MRRRSASVSHAIRFDGTSLRAKHDPRRAAAASGSIDPETSLPLRDPTSGPFRSTPLVSGYSPSIANAFHSSDRSCNACAMAQTPRPRTVPRTGRCARPIVVHAPRCLHGCRACARAGIGHRHPADGQCVPSGTGYLTEVHGVKQNRTIQSGIECVPIGTNNLRPDKPKSKLYPSVRLRNHMTLMKAKTQSRCRAIIGIARGTLMEQGLARTKPRADASRGA